MMSMLPFRLPSLKILWKIMCGTMCGREVGNELHKSLSYDAVGLHLPGESHQQSLFGYLRKCGYGAARRAINAQVLTRIN